MVIRGFTACRFFQRYHESLGNVTPADVHTGHDREIWDQRERIKRQTLALRRKQNRQLVAAGERKEES